MRKILLLSFLLVAVSAFAKDQPGQVVNWPASGTPLLRFTFAKFKEVGSVGNQRSYMIDTTANNLWDKKISHIGFSVYFYDKDKVRIGQGWIALQDVAPGQAVKFQTSFGASGVPVSLELIASTLPPELQGAKPAKTISMTVNSVPQGAALKLDGNEIGTTPKLVQIGVGKHLFEFSKEGFNSGKFPVEVGPDDASGGSVSYELGTAVHDTLELRDGSVITGDVESVSATDVVIRMAGNTQHLNRNQVKRILFVERDMPMQR